MLYWHFEKGWARRLGQYGVVKPYWYCLLELCVVCRELLLAVVFFCCIRFLVLYSYVTGASGAIADGRLRRPNSPHLELMEGELL